MENQKNMIETALAAAQKPFYEFTPNGTPLVFTPVGEGEWEVKSEDSGQTEKNLKAFERFGISFTPYQGGDSYFVEALLKFRIDKNSGALNLWYELQQIDAIIEQAAKDIADELQNALADTEIYFGKF